MRMMDRPMRPLFPEGFIDEVQIQCWVMSHDGQNDADVVACCGASAAAPSLMRLSRAPSPPSGWPASTPMPGGIRPQPVPGADRVQ